MFIILIVVMASWLYTRIKALIAQLKVCAVHHTSIISQSCKKKNCGNAKGQEYPISIPLKETTEGQFAVPGISICRKAIVIDSMVLTGTEISKQTKKAQ